MKKRILPALLALCMVLSLLPVTVLAAAGDGTCQCTVDHSAEDGSADNKGTATADHSGTCGAATTGYKKFCDNCVGTAQAQKYACSCDGSCQAAEGHVGEHSAAYTLDETGDCQACAAAKEAAQQPGTPAATKCSCGCPIVTDDPQAGDCTAEACAHTAGKTVAAEKVTENCIYTVCTAANCVTYQKTAEKPHTHTCAVCGCPIGVGAGKCSTTECAHNKQDSNPPASCTYVKCDNVDCKKQGTVHLKSEHVIGTDCDATEGVSDAYNTTRYNCTKSGSHVDGCPMACPVPGCTKDKGHTDAHSAAAGCTNNKQCGVAAEGKHLATCPVGSAQDLDNVGEELDSKNVGDKITVTDGLKVYYYRTMDGWVTCTCDSHEASGHGTGTCPNATANAENETGIKKSFKVAVEKTVSFEYTVVGKTQGESTVVDEEATAKAREAAAQAKIDAAANADLAAATTAGVTTDEWNTALAAAVTNYETLNTVRLCSLCTSTCTKAVDCAATTHLKGVCLSQCTHNGSCGNNKGDAAAHVVYYKVMDGQTSKGSYATYEAAVAARTNKSWSIVTDPCPMAQVDESVVVGADEEAPAEDPTKPEEPKAPEKAADFDDLKGDEWYAEDLTALMGKGIIKGSLDAGKYSFGATDKLTTSHLVVFLSRVLDKGLVTEGKDWDKAATAWATEDGLTEGIEAGEITRKDVVLVLWRAAGKPESTQSLEALTDVEGLTEDEAAALRWAVETKVITGYEDNTFKPGNSITRAEMVAVLSRFDGVVNAK